MSLRAQALRGIAWTAAAYGFRACFQLGVLAVLARLLAPTDFGLVAMATIVVNLFALLRAAGLGAAIEQRAEVTEHHLNASFWYGLVCGGALALLVAALAPAIAWLFQEPRLEPVVALGGLGILVQSLGGTHTALLARSLSFRRLATREILAQIAGGVTAIWFAFRGFGAYSLVIQAIVAGAVGTTMLWFSSPWRPTASFRMGALREIWGFGAQVTGAQLMSYVFRNADAFLVGRFLSAASLGFYHQAYRIMRAPVEMIHQVMTRVMFPALSKLEDPAAFRTAYVSSLRLLTGAAFFPASVLLVLAEPLVLVVFGPQWERTSVLLQLFALAGYLQIIYATLGWIFRSRGRPDLQLRLGMAVQPLTLVAVILGLRWDAEGVALAYVFAHVAALFMWPIAFKLIQLRTRELLHALRGAGLASVASVGSMSLGLHIMDQSAASPLGALLVPAAIGACAYALALHIADRGWFALLLSTARTAFTTQPPRDATQR